MAYALQMAAEWQNRSGPVNWIVDKWADRSRSGNGRGTGTFVNGRPNEPTLNAATRVSAIRIVGLALAADLECVPSAAPRACTSS